MIVACGGCKYQFELVSYRDAQCPGCGEIAPLVRPPQSCPACKNALATRHVSDVLVDECKRCGGLFLDDEVVRRMLEAGHQARAEAVLAAFAARPPEATRPTKSRPSPPPRDCPTCGTPMKRKLSPEGAGIILDVCVPHGTFFDAGELHEIVEFAQREIRERGTPGAPWRVQAKQTSDPSRLIPHAVENSSGDNLSSVGAALLIILDILAG